MTSRETNEIINVLNNVLTIRVTIDELINSEN